MAVIARSGATKQSRPTQKIWIASRSLSSGRPAAGPGGSQMTEGESRRKRTDEKKRRPMHIITLDSETDFEGWRRAARALVRNDARPADVTWKVAGAEPELFATETSPLPEVPEGAFSVPAKFVELAQSAILHRDGERFAILYRLLWRARRNHDTLSGGLGPAARGGRVRGDPLSPVVAAARQSRSALGGHRSGCVACQRHGARRAPRR